MLDFIFFLFDVLLMWGLSVGLQAAVILTYMISHYLWGEFHLGLFVALATLFVPFGVFMQIKYEKN